MPTKNTDSWSIPSKLAVTVIGVLLSAAISFNVWAVAAVHERPTRVQVERLIQTESPYKEDRNMLLRSLERIHEDIKELKELLRDIHGANK